jgi:hypothetical protein
VIPHPKTSQIIIAVVDFVLAGAGKKVSFSGGMHVCLPHNEELFMIYFKDDPTDPENRNKPYRTLGNNFFKRSLVVLLAFGVLSNVFSVFILKNTVSVIGLIFQGMTLVSIFQKWRYQELLVKIWASM